MAMSCAEGHAHAFGNVSGSAYAGPALIVLDGCKSTRFLSTHAWYAQITHQHSTLELSSKPTLCSKIQAKHVAQTLASAQEVYLILAAWRKP